MTTALQTYITLHQRKLQLESELSAAKEAAIAEALDTLANSDSDSRIVGEYSGFRAVVRMVTKKPDKTPNIEYLEEMIQLEKEKAERENAGLLLQNRDRIKVLEELIEKLSITDQGRQFQAELDKIIREGTEKIASLAIQRVKE